MTPLSASEIAGALEEAVGWRIEGGMLVRELTFGGFVEAVAFVDRLAILAEQAGHHPDIDIRYNRVRLALTTHDAGGLTRRDFDLAKAVDAHI